MTFTIAGFGEDLDLADAEANLAALADAHLFTQGDDLRVPSLNHLLAVSGGLASGGTQVLRLEAPSIRDNNRLRVAPLNGQADADVEPASPLAIMDMTVSPRRLEADEILQCIARSNTSAAAFQWLIAFFGDGRPVAVTPDEVITVRATSGTTLTARAGTTGALTFPDTLLVGRYQVVGLRAFGVSPIAARFVFKGAGPSNWRPGGMALDSQTSPDWPMQRMGRLGVWGEFHSTQPPDIEVLADAADSAQTFDLDLVKVA